MKDLYEMSQAELDELIKAAKETKHQTKQQAVEALRAKVAEVVAEAQALGTSLAAINRTPREKVYFNPQKPEQGWAGKGRKPKWVQDYIDANGIEALENCRTVSADAAQA